MCRLSKCSVCTWMCILLLDGMLYKCQLVYLVSVQVFCILIDFFAYYWEKSIQISNSSYKCILFLLAVVYQFLHHVTWRHIQGYYVLMNWSLYSKMTFFISDKLFALKTSFLIRATKVFFKKINVRLVSFPILLTDLYVYVKNEVLGGYTTDSWIFFIQSDIFAF